jgi:DNA (cytosine-5)-methyltransferase 1
MTEEQILQNALKKALIIVKKNQLEKFSKTVKNDVDFLIEKIDQNKSIVTAIVTSLVKKIKNKEQDIHLHRVDFEDGYSARSLDTKVTCPFFKNYFPKYANKETAFLTLALRERIIWNKSQGNSLKIRNQSLKESFLNIFDQIENHHANPQEYLNYLIGKLIILSAQDEVVLQNANLQLEKLHSLNISIILTMLEEHFSNKLSSRLPVIAIYSIYQVLIPNLKRYKNKRLIPLQVHTSSDKHGFGDIEIYSNNDKPFEIIEVKHNIPLDKYLIFDIVKKTNESSIDRYYILTTFKAGFIDNETEKNVNEFIVQIKQSKGIDIIANGIITTLKYYLRFIDDYRLFVKKYTENLIIDASNSTEVKTFHIQKWNEILQKYGVDKN